MIETRSCFSKSCHLHLSRRSQFSTAAHITCLKAKDRTCVTLPLSTPLSLHDSFIIISMKHSATIVAKTTWFQWAPVAKQTHPLRRDTWVCVTLGSLWHYQSLPGSKGVRKKETSEGAGRDWGSCFLSCLALAVSLHVYVCVVFSRL